VGHASQLPKAGDFFTTYIGRNPILVTRGVDSEIRAFFNKCPHRGAMLCIEERGSASQGFSCPYHGWYFDSTGRLAGVPFRGAYERDLRGDPMFSLFSVPRMEVYRGFIFVSLALNGQSLRQHLGPMVRVIDNLVDRAPGGEIELDAGVHRYAYHGNWKFQLENVVDGYHPPFTHASTLGEGGQQLQRSYAASGYEMVVPSESLYETGIGKLDQAETHVFPNGHSYLTNPAGDHRSGKVVDQYWEALRDRLGAEQVELVRSNMILNAAFYPNLVVRVTDNEHIRVARPVSVDYTEVYVWPVRLKGAPRELATGIVQHSNIHTSATSFIQTDDLELFERCQRGMQACSPEWVYFGRGLKMEREGKGDGELVGQGTWEGPFRAQFEAWRSLMVAEK
jgi:benzoate/toluate 1,2-dioxygenase subunit alpha